MIFFLQFILFQTDCPTAKTLNTKSSKPLRKMKRFYLSLIWLIFSVLAINPTFSQGMDFRQDDWQNVVSQAKTQKKLIFVDIYTTWCDSSKEMDKRLLQIFLLVTNSMPDLLITKLMLKNDLE